MSVLCCVHVSVIVFVCVAFISPTLYVGYTSYQMLNRLSTRCCRLKFRTFIIATLGIRIQKHTHYIQRPCILIIRRNYFLKSDTVPVQMDLIITHTHTYLALALLPILLYFLRVSRVHFSTL